MFGLGVPELVVILVIALLIFGPNRLPEVGKNFGKAIREFKKTADDIKNDVTNSTGLDETGRNELKSALGLEEVRKDIEDVGQDLAETVALGDAPDGAKANEAKTDDAAAAGVAATEEPAGEENQRKEKVKS